MLGIETSCDDTGVALYDGQRGLLAHRLSSQIETHREYGGVVPELAARDHIRKVVPLVETVLAAASIKTADIDGIAYTAGPGLAGALLVGVAIGRSLAYGWNCPAVGVHHLEGHLLAPMLESNHPDFPFLALLVSGGHTLLVDVEALGQYQIIGQTLDDAAGEAFDKTARLLGLGYPGGSAIEQCAKSGDPNRFDFPRPMTDRPGLDMSFSGLKTFTRTTAQSHTLDKQTTADIARAFQDAAVDTLTIKCRRALQQTAYRQLVIAGGVGANSALRQSLINMASAESAEVFYPRPEFCTDNGAMIAYAGYQRLLSGEHQPLEFGIRPRWSIDELAAIKMTA